jgi:large-conductance mechanosensitive channel
MSHKEYQMVKKYTDIVEIVKLQFDLPGGMTVLLTYRPPNGFVLIPDYSVSGPNAYGVGVITAYSDGTIMWNNVTSSEVLEHIMAAGDIRNVRNKMDMYISNTDTTTHTVDFMIVGFLIPSSKEEEWIDEVTGRKDTRLLEEIRDLLKFRKL